MSPAAARPSRFRPCLRALWRLAAVMALVAAASPAWAQEGASPEAIAQLSQDDGATTPLMFLAEEFRVPPRPLEAPGAARAWAMNDLIFAGDAAPDGAEGFRVLADLGVRTVISIDFSPPDANAAAAAGLETVHSPVAHGRWRPGDVTTLLRVITYLEGPYYLHAAPGEDRVFALAALAAAWNERLGPGRVVYLLEEIGYPREGREGVWGDIESPRFAWIQRSRIQPVPSHFPARLPPPSLAEWMQRFAEHADWIDASRSFEWSYPEGWPASAPAFEAESLAAAMGRWRTVDDARPELHDRMAAAEARARELASALRSGEPDAAEDAWQSLRAACAECHIAERDGVP